MRRGLITVLSALLLSTSVGVAAASTSRVQSTPNGDIDLLVSVGCGGTDRDKDGNFNTCVSGDTASMVYSVGNLTDAAQTVRVVATFDEPGTELDKTTTHEVSVPAHDLVNFFDELRIERHTELGAYTLRVQATGTESAATSAGVTVQRKNAK